MTASVAPAASVAGAPSPDEWLRCMRRGDFEGAWRVGDALRALRGGAPTWHLPRHQQQVWDGTPPHGRRVLVRCYHGLGDTLLFARYLPLLAAVAAEVTVWAQPPLLPLLAQFAGIVRLLPLHDGTPEVAYDVDVEVMELPWMFRSTLDTLPARVPYLHAEPVAIPRDGRRQVGLVWECGDWEREKRSIPGALLAPLADVPGVAWHLLQRGPALADAPPGLGHVTGHDDVAEAARVVRALDLVVTVDTMPAHLAGALAVPTWVLLPHDADWRWMETRADSPWYPTMRLWRQDRPGDWAGLLARVADALATPALHPLTFAR